MKFDMQVPRLNTNDDEMDLVEWMVEPKSYVEAGTTIAMLESSKTVVEIENSESGYFLPHVEEEQTVTVGAPLATFFKDLSDLEIFVKRDKTEQVEFPSIADTKQDVVPAEAIHEEVPVDKKDSVKEGFNFTRFSKAAKFYIEHNKVDRSRFEKQGLITLGMIESALGNTSFLEQSLDVESQVLPQITSRKIELVKDSNLRSEKVSKSKGLEIDYLTDGQAGLINSSITVQFNSSSIRQVINDRGLYNGQILPVILYEFSRLLEEFPKFTAYYDSGNVHFYDQVNIGLAVDLDKGLKVAVIKDANTMSHDELFERAQDHVIRYFENKLSSEDLTGGTVTVTDLSSDNVLNFQPLINRNQSVILGIGGDQDIDGYPMTLTLVFDHRVSVGREVAAFLNALKKRVLNFTFDKSEKNGSKDFESLGNKKLQIAFTATSSNFSLNKFQQLSLTDALGNPLDCDFVQVKEMPRLTNGEIDLEGLRTQALESQFKKSKDEPLSEVQQQIAIIWQELLNITQVGLHDNFFQLGGHSLLATQMVTRINDRYDVSLPLRALFTTPTIAAVASYVDDLVDNTVLGSDSAKSNKSLVSRVSIQGVSRSDEIPLSFAQQRLWFLDQLEPGTAFYNIPVAVRLTVT